MFFKQKLKRFDFVDCNIIQTDFSEYVLTKAKFTNCDLLNTNFIRNTFSKADFQTANNFQISPNSNKLKKAKLSVNGLPGLLEVYDMVDCHWLWVQVEN
ncbi:MAG: pentapeptide repeat-containing protein [Bacteroidales bacterium]|nr:pentapeptide repeat-containing protein [Bacteroidales bacterium]